MTRASGMIPAGDIEADGIYGVTGEGTFVVHQVSVNQLGHTVIKWSWRTGPPAWSQPGPFEWSGSAASSFADYREDYVIHEDLIAGIPV